VRPKYPHDGPVLPRGNDNGLDRHVTVPGLRRHHPRGDLPFGTAAVLPCQPDADHLRRPIHRPMRLPVWHVKGAERLVCGLPVRHDTGAEGHVCGRLPDRPDTGERLVPTDFEHLSDGLCDAAKRSMLPDGSGNSKRPILLFSGLETGDDPRGGCGVLSSEPRLSAAVLCAERVGTVQRAADVPTAAATPQYVRDGLYDAVERPVLLGESGNIERPVLPSRAVPDLQRHLPAGKAGHDVPAGRGVRPAQQ
jgi:hypothetical protein